MRSYSNEEKQMIMIFSDLLSEPLSYEELVELEALKRDSEINIEYLSTSPIKDDLKEKIDNLLKQGVKLSFELENIEQRGINIEFTNKSGRLKNILSEFSWNPKFLFILGNEKLIEEKSIDIFKDYNELKDFVGNAILICDREFSELLSYPDIIKLLEKGKLLLISDRYRKKSNIKGMEKIRKSQLKNNNKKVFISGSRSQVEITANIQKSLEDIIKQNITVLIGDSEKGVDNEIIDFLRHPTYEHVEVYTISKNPRIKTETMWETNVINFSTNLKPQERQMVKDREMASEADWGMAIFKPIIKNRYGSIQVSSGTLRNTIQMLLNGKAVKFFFVYSNNMEVKNLKKLSDLEDVIVMYKFEKLSDFEIQEILSSRGVGQEANPSLVKYEKIYKKYKELLKKEQRILFEEGESFSQHSDELKQISFL